MIWRMIGVLGKVEKRFEHALLPKKRQPTRTLAGHTLYHFQMSPFSARVRREIARLGLEIPGREVLLDDAAHAELISQGGKDQVPCLRIESASGVRWMYESGDIIRYLRSVF